MKFTLPVLPESCLQHMYRSIHRHGERGSFVSDDKVLCQRSVNETILGQFQSKMIVFWTQYGVLLYGKPSLRQIPVLWLVLSLSGFCSTDRFHGNGPTHVFLFWSEAGKFKICNQNSEKNLWILSFFTVKLPEEAKKIEIFPKFQILNCPEWKEASDCYRWQWGRLTLKPFFINFVQFWINFHSFTWHWLNLYFVTKKILFNRQETLSRVLESTTAFVRFRYKAFLKLHFIIRNRVPLHFTIRNTVPYNKPLTNRACSGRTEEYWPSVVAVRTSLRSVRTATTSGQYSPVRPSRSVSKRLLLFPLNWP